jgi:hypothetical protein
MLPAQPEVGSPADEAPDSSLDSDGGSLSDLLSMRPIRSDDAVGCKGPPGGELQLRLDNLHKPPGGQDSSAWITCTNHPGVKDASLGT